jgi:predicted P-loop ATPase
MPDKKQNNSEDIISPFAEDDTIKRAVSRKTKISAFEYAETDQYGYPKTTLGNVHEYISKAPRWKDSIKYDKFQHFIFFENKKIRDEDLTEFRIVAEAESGIKKVSKDLAKDIIHRYAFQNEHNSFIDYLDSLTWDGTPRMHEWLRVVWGHNDPTYEFYDYVGKIGYSWLLALMNRTIRPGCKFDHMLVFLGQAGGSGKTSVMPLMFENFNNNCVRIITTALNNKDTLSNVVRGVCVVNFDEGTALKKADNELQKTFITQQVDTFRAPYGMYDVDYPRQVVFMATSNNMEAIQDVTGSRRYWVVDCEKMADFDYIKENRGQLLAEAYHRAKSYEEYKFPDVKDQDAVIDNYRSSDLIENDIIKYLSTNLDFVSGKVGIFYSTADIAEHALGVKDFKDMDFHVKMNFSNTMKALHFKSTRGRVDGKSVRGWVSTEKTTELTKRNGYYQADLNF